LFSCDSDHARLLISSQVIYTERNWLPTDWLGDRSGEGQDQGQSQ